MKFLFLLFLASPAAAIGGLDIRCITPDGTGYESCGGVGNSPTSPSYITPFGAGSFTKGVQSSTGIYIQALKDTGRTRIVFSTGSMSGVSGQTVNMTTFSYTKGGARTNGVTTYTVTAAKTLRLQTLTLSAYPNVMPWGVAFASVTFQILESSAPTSTLIDGAYTLFLNSGPASMNLTFYDGLELPAGTVLGISHWESTGAVTEEWDLTGFEY